MPVFLVIVWFSSALLAFLCHFSPSFSCLKHSLPVFLHILSSQSSVSFRCQFLRRAFLNQHSIQSCIPFWILYYNALFSLNTKYSKCVTLFSLSSPVVLTFRAQEKWKWRHSVESQSLWPHGLYSLPGSFVHGFSRQEHWSGLPFPSPGDLPNPGIEPRSPVLWALPSEPPGERKYFHSKQQLFPHVVQMFSITG